MRVCTDCGQDIQDDTVAWGPAHYPRCTDCNRKRNADKDAREADFRERVNFSDQPNEAVKPLKERELRG